MNKLYDVNTLRSNLIMYLKNNHLQQKDLAKYTGVDAAQISRFINGKTKIHKESFLKKVIEFMGAPYDNYVVCGINTSSDYHLDIDKLSFEEIDELLIKLLERRKVLIHNEELEQYLYDGFEYSLTNTWLLNIKDAGD